MPRNYRASVGAKAGTLSLSAGSYSANELATLNVPVTRTVSYDGDVAVDWAVTGLTEGAPVVASGTLRWADQDSASKTISLTFTAVTANRSGTLTLSNPRVLRKGKPPSLGTSSATVTVLNATGTTTLTVEPAAVFAAGADVALGVSSPPIGGGEYSGLTPTVVVTNSSQLASALASATAGAIIGVDPGIYTGTPNGENWTPVWHPAYSGTAGSPIRIVAKYAATSLSNLFSNANRSELRSGTTGLSSVGNPTFGSNGRNYVEWYGFACDLANSMTWTEKAPVVITGGATGVRIDSCVLQGGQVSYNDNIAGIRFENCVSPYIRNCKMYSFRNSAANSNSAGMMFYGARDFLLENCEVYDDVSALYIKGNIGGLNYGVVRRCYFHDYSYIRIQEIDSTTGRGVTFENCIAEAYSQSGFFITNFGVPNLVTIDNCTMVSGSGVDGGFFTENNPNALTIRDCIFYGTVANAQLINCYAMSNSFLSITNNNYYDESGWRNYKGNSTPISSVAAWASATGETGGVSVNPNFIGGSGAAAYKRSSYDGRGAYITGSETIGVS